MKFRNPRYKLGTNDYEATWFVAQIISRAYHLFWLWLRCKIWMLECWLKRKYIFLLIGRYHK